MSNLMNEEGKAAASSVVEIDAVKIMDDTEDMDSLLTETLETSKEMSDLPTSDSSLLPIEDVDAEDAEGADTPDAEGSSDAKKDADCQDARKPESSLSSVSSGSTNTLESRTPSPPSTEYRYSRRKLLNLSHKPASLVWPSCLDKAFCKSPDTNIWDPDKWVRERLRLNQVSKPAPPAKLEKTPEVEIKRTKDPKEHIKQEEQDGIVLSPQRRSFGTGCHGLQQGPVSSTTSNEAPPDRSTRESHREIPARRIGSGRIFRREDPEQVSAAERRDERRENNRRDREQDREDQRRDRDWRSKTDSHEREDRYESRRRERNKERARLFRERRCSQEEETPEWFSSGPTSQNEYIELVGFDDDENVKASKSAAKKEKKNSKKEGSNKNSCSNTPVIFEDEELQDDAAALGAQKQAGLNIPDELRNGVSEQTSVCEAATSLPMQPTIIEPPPEQDGLQFNIDDFLGDIIGFPSEENDDMQENSSNLKQLFGRTSPIMDPDSSSRKMGVDYPPLISTLLGDMATPENQLPDQTPGLDSSHFFAPISPAGKTTGSTIAELLQQHVKDVLPPDNLVGLPNFSAAPGSKSVKDLLMNGKGQSLEEIEASFQKNRMAHYLPDVMTSSANHQHQSVNAINDFLLNGAFKDAPNLIKPTALGQHPLLSGGQTEPDILSWLKGSGNQSSSFNQHLGNSMPPLTRPTPPSLNHPMTNMPPPSVPHHSQRTPHPPNQEFLMKFLQKSQQKPSVVGPQQQRKLPHQQSQQQLDPIKQLVGGIGQMSLSQQDQLLREALLVPDIQNLLRRVIIGQVTDAQLVAQLGNANLNASQRDTILTVLKILKTPPSHANQLFVSNVPRTTLTPSPTPQVVVGGGMGLNNTASVSPRIASPNPDATSLLVPQMRQQQRLSPLMFGGNQLAVGGSQRPIFSYKELVAHAQKIHQEALIKQELEKAKEKHRKRDTDRGHSPNQMTLGSFNQFPVGLNPNLNKDISGYKLTGKSQSPLAFTPTSVMRRMTADKERMDRSDKPSCMDDLLHRDDMRDRNAGNWNCRPTPQQPSVMVPGGMHPQYGMQHNKNDKRDLRQGASPHSLGNTSMLGTKGHVMMGGANHSLMNMQPGGHSAVNAAMHNASHRHPNVGLLNMSRNTQQNVSMRGGYPTTLLAAQMLQNQRAGHGPPPVSGISGAPSSGSLMGSTNLAQQRMTNSSAGGAVHPYFMNNNPPPGMHLKPEAASPFPLGTGSHRSSPVNNLIQFLAQAQPSGMPELPGGKVLSLEEVERRQQTQPVPN